MIFVIIIIRYDGAGMLQLNNESLLMSVHTALEWGCEQVVTRILFVGKHDWTSCKFRQEWSFQSPPSPIPHRKPVEKGREEEAVPETLQCFQVDREHTHIVWVGKYRCVHVGQGARSWWQGQVTGSTITRIKCDHLLPSAYKVNNQVVGSNRWERWLQLTMAHR